MQNLPDASAKPPCEWTEPESKILAKTEEDLTMDMGEFGGSKMVATLIFVALLAGGGYYYFGM